MKPAKEQIEAAHKWFDSQFLRDMRQQRAITAGMLEILFAATTPDPGPPRPDDMAELARLVAIELRRRGNWARMTTLPWNVEGVAVLSWNDGFGASWKSISLDNYPKTSTPCEIANAIQAEEATKAAEWAGDAS